MSYIGKKIKKIDSDALLSGKPVYTNDLAPKECLIVKLLHSPHAYAKILEINAEIAKKVPGIECILTHKMFLIIDIQMLDKLFQNHLHTTD